MKKVGNCQPQSHCGDPIEEVSFTGPKLIDGNHVDVEAGAQNQYVSMVQMSQLQSQLQNCQKRLLKIETQPHSGRKTEPLNLRLRSESTGASSPPPVVDGVVQNDLITPSPTHGSRQDPRHPHPSGSRSPDTFIRAADGLSPFRDRGPESAPHEQRKVEPGKKIFDQSLLSNIYDKPYKRARKQGAMVGGGVAGIMSMPFGPIGMVAGGVFGATVGAAVGFWYDRRVLSHKKSDADKAKRRLKALVRWALDHFHEDEDFVKILEMVVLEFKPIAEIADGSKSARKLLKLLDAWIAQKKVTRHLWGYMEELLKRWRDLNRNDFTRSMIVFQTLRTMYKFSQRQLDEQEIAFIERMEKLLSHESVKLIMYHASMLPTEGETRIMECMVYADARQSGRKHSHEKKTSGHHSPPSHTSPNSPMPDADLLSIVSDEEEEPAIENYHWSSNGTWHHANDQSTLNGDAIGSSTPDEEQPIPQPPVEKKLVKVLKKPFFRDFKDFMDFDDDFKHRLPITLCEFDFLRQKADEPLEGWDVCVDRKEIKVAKTQTETGCITLRAWSTVPGVDLIVAFYLFSNHTERVKWDKVFAKMSIVAPDVQGSEILYSLMKVPAVTARDFLQYRRCIVTDDGKILILLRSAVHQDMPDQKGSIRAESYIAGYILHQTFNGSTPVLHIFLMSCVDIKGLIPKWVINVTAPRKPAEWVETLRKAALEYQEANPKYKETLKEELARYRQENPYDFEMVPEVGGEDVHSHQAVAALASDSTASMLTAPTPRTPTQVPSREVMVNGEPVTTPKDEVQDLKKLDL